MSEALDLFVRLSKYPAGKDVTPFENFFTEAFAFLLGFCAPLRERFLSWLCDVNAARQLCTITTQRTLPDGSRPDLFISVGSHRIYIENKVWSDLNQYVTDEGDTINQVRKYVDNIPDDELATAGVKLITARPVTGLAELHRGPLAFRPDRDYRLWQDVYKMMQDVRHQCAPVGAFLIDSLSTLMEEYDMAPFDGIGRALKDIAESYEDVRSAATRLHRRLQSGFSQLLDEIVRGAGQEVSRRGGAQIGETEPYAGAYIKVSSRKPWVGIYFGTETFLHFAFKVPKKDYQHLGEDDLRALKEDLGYALDEWHNLGKTTQLPEASGENEARRQIAEGADFLRRQIEVWGRFWEV